MSTKKVFLSGIFALSSISVFSQITYTAPISTIYEGYGNTIVINGVKNPTFQASNAEVLASENSNTIKLIPKIDAETVKLTVLSQGKVVDTKEFKVIQLPLATVHFVKDGKPLDVSNGIEKNIENLSIQIIPSTETKEESQYTAEVSVIIKRNGKTIFTKENVAFGSLLDDILQKTEKDDIVSIRTTTVKRKNSKGEYVFSKIYNPILNVPIK
ncbi:hypothetical protein AD998_11870 [bacterium 336/3]|nr:hypothetical protein AD998_11870 [bacterium 336/3]